MIIAQKEEAFAVMVTRKDKIIAEKEGLLSEFQTEFRKFRQEFMESTKMALDYFFGVNTYQFVLENFSRCQNHGLVGDWFSDPFSVSGYDLVLNMETRKIGPNMKIRLYPSFNVYHRSVKLVAMLQLLNQLGDHSHHFKKISIELQKGCAYSNPYDFIPFMVLYRRDETVQYLKDDSLKLCIWIRSHD